MPSSTSSNCAPRSTPRNGWLRGWAWKKGWRDDPFGRTEGFLPGRRVAIAAAAAQDGAASPFPEQGKGRTVRGAGEPGRRAGERGIPRGQGEGHPDRDRARDEGRHVGYGGDRQGYGSLPDGYLGFQGSAPGG